MLLTDLYINTIMLVQCKLHDFFCWYSLGRPVTIGTPMVIFAVLTVFDHYCTNRHRSTKTVPIVYKQCTNRQKQSKDSKNSKNDHWCTNRHMSTQSPPNTQSPAAGVHPVGMISSHASV